MSALSLPALAERVEILSANPSRIVDCEIQIALTPDAKCMTNPGGQWVGGHMQGSSFGPMSEIDYVAWGEHERGLEGAFYYGTPPAFTASVDAAKSIWPEGWFIRVTQVRYGMWQVEGWHGDKSVKTPADVCGLAASEQAARTAAALRAIAMSSSEKSE